MDFLTELWKKLLEPWFSPLWGSLIFWRIVALLSLTLLTVIIIYREMIIDFLKAEKYKEHDRKLFETMNEFINEPQTRDLITTVSDFTVEDFDRMETFHADACTPEGKFLVPKVNKAFEKYMADIGRYVEFVNLHFQSNGRDIYVFEEALRFDARTDPKAKQKYDSLKSEFLDILSAANKSFENYRTTIKKELLI